MGGVMVPYRQGLAHMEEMPVVIPRDTGGRYCQSINNWRIYGNANRCWRGGGVDSGSAPYTNLVSGQSTILMRISLQTGIGKVISKEGNLDANTLDVSLVWRFGTPK